MTVKEAFDSIVEDGIALGAGDFVEPEALEVAALVMAKVLRGHLVEVVRCKDCKHYIDYGDGNKICKLWTDEWDAATDADAFCSYGERRTDDG